MLQIYKYNPIKTHNSVHAKIFKFTITYTHALKNTAFMLVHEHTHRLAHNSQTYTQI